MFPVLSITEHVGVLLWMWQKQALLDGRRAGVSCSALPVILTLKLRSIESVAIPVGSRAAIIVNIMGNYLWEQKMM